MPNKPATPNRNAGRIKSRTWTRAAVAAQLNKEDRSVVIARLLDAYADETYASLTPAARRIFDRDVASRMENAS